MHSEMVEAEGQNVQRYVYGTDGARISAEFTYADGTARGNGGENILSDMAAKDNKKIYYRRSLLDSTLFAVDESGDVFQHQIYDAWGNPGLETKLDANYMGVQNLNNFTGYTWDETLGLYFAQNRFYDSVSHRFTQEDPVKDGTNWFAYCENNPLTNVDIDGLLLLKNGTVSRKKALKNIQKWLVDLGYMPEKVVRGHYGENYGGHTIAAMQLFYLNYGKEPKEYASEYDYLMLANAVVDAKYANSMTRSDMYKRNIASVRAWDNYRNSVSYYRRYSCVMEKYHRIIASNNYAQKVSIKNTKTGYSNYIYYFDYTNEIKRVLRNYQSSFERHKVTWGNSLEKNFDNLIWFYHQMKPYSTWDIKERASWEKLFNLNYYSQQFRFFFNGKIETSESMGNITYGYLGRKLGLPLTVLQDASWLVGLVTSNEIIHWDAIDVSKGYNLQL